LRVCLHACKPWRVHVSVCLSAAAVRVCAWSVSVRSRVPLECACVGHHCVCRSRTQVVCLGLGSPATSAPWAGSPRSSAVQQLCALLALAELECVVDPVLVFDPVFTEVGGGVRGRLYLGSCVCVWRGD
jgi:hypothetical protein